MATAIEQADTAADDAVVTAENDLLDDQATLASARAAELQSAAAAADGEATDVTQTDIDAAVTELDSVAADSRMSDANLNAAETEAQADVDADETVYASDGTDISTLTAVYEVAGDTATDSGLTTDPSYISEDFADVAQESTIDLSGLTDSATFSVTVNGTEYTTAWDTNLDTTGGALATEVSTDSNVTASYAGGTLTVTGAAAGEDVSVSNTGGGADAVVSVAAFNTADYIEANDVSGYAADTNISSGLVDSGASNVSTETGTASEWQQAIADAEQAVESFVSVNGDNAALLDSVRDAINAHIGAGGENAEAASGVNLLDVRDNIATILDVEEVNEGDVDAEVSIIAGYDFTFEAAEGEELTAAEQAVNAAVADTEERVELNGDVQAAKASFDLTGTGEVLNTIKELQEDRQELVDAVSDAESELSDAQDLAAQTQGLVDDLAQLDASVEEAETSLEDEGFAVEAIDSADEAGTADNDIFLLGDTDAAIDNFAVTETNAEGEVAGDRIYVGEQRDVVTADDITDDLGDASALEAIVVDNGTDTSVFFEEKVFAGNSSSDSADMTEVTLTGVTGGEVSINSDGFLTVA
ncbi:hypothetical protein [Chromohalobacter canadensis]|uniref:hypothetical protein n=1 Tax=Chromohalobacter canadensis TaxID=141389 RepID=UPI00240F9122|nr:hypothetical protein [Chromohalobacter canadensis]